ncbi:subtilisin-like protein [Obba rivulosa]|uniref:tripeptidyl-peptidase II n=1 Tax=Obba rivulosa TaxID=1052685 RepID=A0A8E2AUK6_9APHY|nr:subtilisin-like protein [Obba rivulosa]
MHTLIFGICIATILFAGHPATAYPLYDRADITVKHEWTQVPHNWELQGEAPSGHPINLRIGLKQGKLDELITTLYEVSDPFHARYGQHLTKEETEALVAPSEETFQAVHNWLAFHGVDISSIAYSPARDWLSLQLPLARVEAMLSTKYHAYQHVERRDTTIRTLSYSLPRALHDHIDVIHPTTLFGNMHDFRATSHITSSGATFDSIAASNGATVKGSAGQDIPISCNTTVTPACLQVLYRTDGYVPKAADKGNRIGIAGYLEQFVNFADLQTFFSMFRIDAVGANVTVISVDGGLNDQSTPGVEANLDTQYTEGLTFPTPNVYYTTPGTAPTINDSVTPPQRDEPYIDWLQFVLSHDDMPQTFTTSYGGDEQTFPIDFATRACNLFAQLGARGASVMFSSGDGGVGAGTCETNDGTNRTIFQPVFPATCPFVTGVGATFHIAPERGIDFSQGGFSVYFPRPAYQAAAVPPFLKNLGSTYAGLFNPAGRGVPDVSAQGEGFQVVVGGSVESVGGTSASSPTFAGIISLLNDFRISQGKPSLGFLNPLLYSVGLPAFTDITLGNNPGCGTPGFNATEGWDAITGLGTPDFVKFQEFLGKL